MIVLSIDPGETSGYAIFQDLNGEPAKRIAAGHIHGGLEGFIEWWNGEHEVRGFTVVVCEKFKLDGRAHKTSHLEPIRIEGALRVLWGDDVVWQDNQHLRHASDGLLERHGLKLTGKQVGHTDANDAHSATKHALAYYKKHHESTRSYYWPER